MNAGQWRPVPPLLVLVLCAGCVSTEGDLLTRLQPAGADGGSIPACVTSTAGDATQCSADTDLKQRAMQDCANRGLALDDGLADLTEDCGTGQSHFATYFCCPAALLPQCMHPTQGSTMTCQDQSTWKTAASNLCTSAGQVLQGYFLGTPCGGTNYRGVRALCCPG